MRKIDTVIIATTDKAMMSLLDRTYADPDSVVEELVSGRMQGAVVLDEERAAQIAVKAALRIAPLRTKYKWGLMGKETIVDYARRCSMCRNCERDCPQNLPISSAMASAAKGDVTALASLYRILFRLQKV